MPARSNYANSVAVGASIAGRGDSRLRNPPAIACANGLDRIRTGDLCNANAALYQLSYKPTGSGTGGQVRMRRNTTLLWAKTVPERNQTSI